MHKKLQEQGTPCLYGFFFSTNNCLFLKFIYNYSFQMNVVKNQPLTCPHRKAGIIGLPEFEKIEICVICG